MSNRGDFLKKLTISRARPRFTAPLLGALLGACVFLAICTPASLDVTNDAWLLQGIQGPDMYQHYAGWVFYRNSPLTFPLGCAEAMSGAAVSFTDSVPVAAIFFRLFGSLLPPVFQYFGLYNLLCMMLQGTAAALLLELFFDDIARILLGTGLFLMQPVLIDRLFRHTSLASQFLIVFALYLYFLNKRKGYRYRIGWLILSGLSITMHPYFVPMVMAMLFADTLSHVVRTKRWAHAALFLVCNIALALLVGWAIGAFSSAGAVDETYGFWSMNLNALWNPASAYVQESCSAVLPSLARLGGNADGFNYAGLGVLLFGAVGGIYWLIFRARKKAGGLLWEHGALIFVCVCLTVFAVTHIVSFGGEILFSLPLPLAIVRLLSTFRASGRMFWPVGYLLLLCVIVFWGRRKKPWGIVCVALLLCLQAWDLSPSFYTKHQLCIGAPEYAYSNPLQSKAWDTMAGQYKRIFSLDSPLEQPYYLALWAAKNGMTTNDPFAARYDAAAHEAQVQTERGALLAGEYDVDTIYLTCRAQEFYPIAIALTKSGADVTCALIDNIWYAVIPNKASVTLPAHSDTFKIYPDLPVTMAEYSDALWTNGVLNSDTRVAIFYDTAAVRAIFTDAAAVLCDGAAYEILKVDDSDEGWLMVTLAVDDAAALAGKPLTRGEAAA